MKLATQLFNENRRADVGTVQGKFNVVFYEDDKQVRIVELHNHGEQYAIDTAENWVLGIIEK